MQNVTLTPLFANRYSRVQLIDFLNHHTILKNHYSSCFWGGVLLQMTFYRQSHHLFSILSKCSVNIRVSCIVQFEGCFHYIFSHHTSDVDRHTASFWREGQAHKFDHRETKSSSGPSGHERELKIKTR